MINKIVQEWIPVSAILPKEDTLVIGTTKYGDVYKTVLHKYRGVYKWYSDDDSDCDLPIVAWVPLPKNYVEKGCD